MATNFQNVNQELSKLLAQAAAAVKIYDHPSAKGDGGEDILRRFLAERVGTAFGISKAEIIDSAGISTNEFDAIIYDQSVSSSLHVLGHRRIVKVESVAVTIEVRTTLKAGELKKVESTISAGLLQLDRRYKPSQALLSVATVMTEKDKQVFDKGLSTISDHKNIPYIVNAVFAYDGPSIDTACKYLTNPLLDVICVLGKYTIARRHPGFSSCEPKAIVEWGVGNDALGAFFHVIEGILENFRESRHWIRPDNESYYRISILKQKTQQAQSISTHSKKKKEGRRLS
jgi:hypothetical protein